MAFRKVCLSLGISGQTWLSWTVNTSLISSAATLRPWGSRHEAEACKLRLGEQKDGKNLGLEEMVALLYQPSDRLRPPPPDLRPMIYYHLNCCYYKVHSLRLSPSPTPSLCLSLSFSLAEHIPSWYISPSPIMDAGQELLCLFIRTRKIAWELHQHPKESTDDAICPQTKPDPPGWTDPKAHHFSSYTSLQINVLIV